MAWIETANGIVTLISGLIALIGACFGVYGMVKAFVTKFMDKKASEQWELIKQIADKAMQAAEKSAATGADKKQMVIDVLSASCKEAGIDIDDFIEQISAYIDNCISFVNGMKK